jgi:hypothetical protein
MTVRRKQKIILNVPIEVVARKVSDVVTGNPLYKNLRVSDDRQTFTFSSVITLTKSPFRWSVFLSPEGTKTIVTVENVSLPFVLADPMNFQNRNISEFLTTLQRVADQTLLRAASAPTAMSDILLRAADTGTATASEELLRPDPHNTEV